MNKILVEVSVGELLDKLSILEIKKEKIKDPEKLKYINDEYKILKSEFDKNVKSGEQLTKLFEDISKFDAPKNQPVIAPSNQFDISCPS